MLLKMVVFSKHPRFHYFALNTTMRQLALETDKIYVYSAANLHWPELSHLICPDECDPISAGQGSIS